MKRNQKLFKVTFLFLILVLLTFVGQAQNNNITGKVIGDDGLELPGVKVLIKGTIQGTKTDFEGNCQHQGVHKDGILVFSFIGMESQEIQAVGKTVI